MILWFVDIDVRTLNTSFILVKNFDSYACWIFTIETLKPITLMMSLLIKKSF